MAARSAVVAPDRIERAILLLRGHKVMLDSDLAALYGVETRALNQAVRRNIERFPDDFMFQLTPCEAGALTSQIVISNDGDEAARGRGGRRTLPYAFTEQGVAMLSSVLRSRRAVQVNVEIMRAFVRLRRMLDRREPPAAGRGSAYRPLPAFAGPTSDLDELDEELLGQDV